MVTGNVITSGNRKTILQQVSTDYTHDESTSTHKVLENGIIIEVNKKR